MVVLPGRQKGTHLYVHDDYLYSKDSRYDNVFRCNSRKTTKCPGYIIIQGNNVDNLKDHNHSKLPFIKAKIKIKEEMLKLSRETNTGLKEIFDSVCRR